MTMLIGQIVGCLLIAAGIGGAVGWSLRHLSASALGQRLVEACHGFAQQRTDTGDGPVRSESQRRSHTDFGK